MTDCKFKVGQVYKNRVGTSYKVVAFISEAAPPCQLIVLRLSDGGVTTRYADGRFGKTAGNDADILPNKRKEWVVTYVFLDDMDERRSYRVFKECEKITAERCAKDLRELTAFRDVRGPMLWEYEE